MIAPVVYAVLVVALAVSVLVVVRATAEPAGQHARPAVVRPSPRPQVPPRAGPPWSPASLPAYRPWPDGPAGQGAQDLTLIELKALSARQAAVPPRPWADDTGSFAAVHFGGQR